MSSYSREYVKASWSTRTQLKHFSERLQQGSVSYLRQSCNDIKFFFILFKDVQLLFSGTPNNLEQLKIYAETSLNTMKEWYSENGLKMNSNKTQCSLFATPNFNNRTERFKITIGDTVRHMEDKVKNLRVIFDSRLSFEHHIKKLCSC